VGFEAPAVVGAFDGFAVELAEGKRKSAVWADIAQRKGFSGGVAAEDKRDIEQHCTHKFSSPHLLAAQRGVPKAPEHFVSVILCCRVAGSHE
jgi:hypothetical protein